MTGDARSHRQGRTTAPARRNSSSAAIAAPDPVERIMAITCDGYLGGAIGGAVLWPLIVRHLAARRSRKREIAYLNHLYRVS